MCVWSSAFLYGLHIMALASFMLISRRLNRALIEVYQLHLDSAVILFNGRFLCEAISHLSGRQRHEECIDLDEIIERRGEETKGEETSG